MMKLPETLKEKRSWGLGLRMLLIGLLLLIFLIPLQMIRSLIQERNRTRLEAEGEIIGSWGGEQVLAGPVVVVPYVRRVTDKNGETEEFLERAFFLPETLEVSGSVNTQKRNRGIYEVTLYTVDLEIRGTFTGITFEDWRIRDADILWQEAALVVELPDMRGLQQRVDLLWGSEEIPFAAGRGEVGAYSGQIRAPLGRAPLASTPRDASGRAPLASTPRDASGRAPAHSFYFDLHLRGGRSLSFLPLGEETRVQLRSAWQKPSFHGAFLPSQRTVSEKGFDAQWHVLSLNRGYGQRWRQGEVDGSDLPGSAFGVELMLPVDTYLKSERSVKYGILFVLLPFAVFFLFEAAGGRRVHAFQYLLVGLAVCVFYLLLVAVSEHLAFDLTYFLASAATVALIAFYSGAVLRTWRRGWIMAAALAAGYLFLYAALRSEDYALLIGALGLFLIVAAVMILTRRLDWYRFGPPEKDARRQARPAAVQEVGPEGRP